MKTVTRTERIGERVSDIDWEYDFRSHFNNLCTSDAGKAEACDRQKQLLQTIEQRFLEKRTTLATTYGGWPRIGYHEVIDVGMYDGWPYWKPVPSVCLKGTLGAEWHAFSCITDIIIDDKVG